jgi:hypothetical protein
MDSSVRPSVVALDGLVRQAKCRALNGHRPFGKPAGLSKRVKLMDPVRFWRSNSIVMIVGEILQGTNPHNTKCSYLTPTVVNLYIFKIKQSR